MRPIFFFSFFFFKILPSLFNLLSFNFSSFRSIYKVPHRPGFDSQRDDLKLRLVGIKVHGRAILLFLIPSFIPDDANLNCTLLSMALQLIGKIDETNMAAENARGAAQGARRFPVAEDHYTSAAPPSGHKYHLAKRLFLKLDGVSHNWGRVMFGFMDHLVASEVFEETLTSRGVVGIARSFSCCLRPAC